MTRQYLNVKIISKSAFCALKSQNKKNKKSHPLFEWVLKMDHQFFPSKWTHSTHGSGQWAFLLPFEHVWLAPNYSPSNKQKTLAAKTPNQIRVSLLIFQHQASAFNK